MAKNAEVIDITEKVEAEQNEKFGTKFVNGVKKHGKRIAKGAAVVGTCVACYVLGSKVSSRLGKTSDDTFDTVEAVFESVN